MNVTLKNYTICTQEDNSKKQIANNVESWELLRSERNDEHASLYHIPEDRKQWQKRSVDDTRLVARADNIISMIKPQFNGICSIGVGGAFVEYVIKHKEPSLSMSCYDFTPNAIKRLKKVFLEAQDIGVFDLLKDPMMAIKEGSVCLLNRIDTEFNDQQWKGIFQKMYKAQVKSILFAPSMVLTPLTVLKQYLKNAILRIKGKPRLLTGYRRTKGRFVELFAEYYCIEKQIVEPNFAGFLLKIK